MAGIYAADIYCDDCIEYIKERVTRDLWAERPESECPDGADCLAFADLGELKDYLEGMDERTYDSGDYPKGCYGSSESDCPEHCGDCGEFLENDLTSDGNDYVVEAVNADLAAGCNDSVACTVWAPFYDYLDFEEGDENE